MLIRVPFFLVLIVTGFHSIVFSQVATETRQYKVTRVKQAVAVDKEHFYVINNSTISRHNKKDESIDLQWDGTKDDIKHLNSGIVIKGKLYCANSNYPAVPMASSIEIFDTKTLQHVGTHSFGIAVYGSLTWIDYKDGKWWAGFAQYKGKGSNVGKDPGWTTVVKFNKNWQQEGAWIFPENIVKAFGTMSNSGGAWGKDGFLYCTGHDAAEFYVMKIPETGYTLRHIKTIAAPVHGQGIAIDHSVKDKLVIYGLKSSEIISVMEIK